MSERGRVLVKMRSVVDRELAEVKPVLDRVVDEALRRGGLSVDEVAELLRGTEVVVGGRRHRLSYVLVRGASESLQARGGAPMYKFNMMPALSCPGAGACVVECYALHGHFVRGNVQSLNAAAHAFVDYVIGRVSREAGVEKAAAVLGALLAGAVKAEAPLGSIIRLHEAGTSTTPSTSRRGSARPRCSRTTPSTRTPSHFPTSCAAFGSGPWTYTALCGAATSQRTSP